MPCHSDYPSDEQIQFAKEKNVLKEELDKVTRLLCATLRLLENEHHERLKANLQFYSHPYLPDNYLQIEGLEDWWNEHKKWDELRLIREEAKRKELEKQNLIKMALSKLSDKEKEALGL